ncbi:hypothetical protein BCR39DRAFT_565191 [Naematelia encephala]|uniref:GDP-fucose protein O-fucosyltransferase-domain-containing protein n=1 Tax=Naematelia encephala TaxID=71784 RepID=A0A1Y2B2Q0_9TREE|nr:hypothetical protein BCR39DRAFT_565191 [Naematelia encephala]
MRITLPNPLGPPIAVDTAHLDNLRSKLPRGIPSPGAIFRRPHFRLGIVLLLIIGMLTLHPTPPFPPSYSLEARMERNLPQLYDDVRYGEGKAGRFIKFDVPQGTGFTECPISDHRLQHHLAVLGNRSLAYEPFVQDRVWLPFRLTSFPWHSSQIPLSAFIATVISGFEAYFNAPRAVPASYYSAVCRRNQRVYSILGDDGLNLVADGQARIHQLQVLLAGSDVGCIRIEGEVFDDPFFDSQAPLELYESFIRSPVMKHFSFSPTVLAIINRAMPKLSRNSELYDLDRVAHAEAEPYRTSMWRHILALHLRRGPEWEAVCEEKGMRSAPFVSFNKLPLLPGNENVPPSSDMVEAARMGLYRAKCLPQTLEIIARARRMRKNHPLLRSIYILTDADNSWAEEIRMWLQSEGWDNVFVGQRDIYPDWQDREVGVAVDMEIARRAGVFVGNGFSTTSSNIVLLRSRDGVHPDLTQFW